VSSVSAAAVVASGDSDTRSTAAVDAGAGAGAAALDAPADDVTVMFSLMAENEYDWKPLIVTQTPRAETASREPQT
jgi:hypothetical protein